MTIEQKISGLQAKIEVLKEEIRKEIFDLIKGESAGWFESVPILESLSWTQYTDYFNDGNECTFSVNTDYFELTFADGKEVTVETYSKDLSSWDEDVFEYDSKNPEHLALFKLLKKVKNILNLIEDEYWKDYLGDHKRIKLTKYGLEVEDYTEHD